jgi:hypothetical protein
MELSKINRNLNLIKRARQLDSKKHFKLLNSDLISWLQSSQINLYCVDQDYEVDGFNMDFSFYYHPSRTIVLNFSSNYSQPLQPFWGKDFSLSYNLILIHELGHYLAYCQNDFSENGAWVQGLKLSKKLNFFSPELADWFTNYFIV